MRVVYGVLPSGSIRPFKKYGIGDVRISIIRDLRAIGPWGTNQPVYLVRVNRVVNGLIYPRGDFIISTEIRDGKEGLLAVIQNSIKPQPLTEQKEDMTTCTKITDELVTFGTYEEMVTILLENYKNSDPLAFKINITTCIRNMYYTRHDITGLSKVQDVPKEWLDSLSFCVARYEHCTDDHIANDMLFKVIVFESPSKIVSVILYYRPHQYGVRNSS